MSDCEFLVNPDIAGIGVRIAIYIQALAGPIVPFLFRSKSLVDSMEKTLGITGLAVLLTTFVYAGRREIDLFHALVVFHLVGLVGFSISATVQNIKDMKFKERVSYFTLRTLYYGSMLGFFIFMIFVFTRAPSFGSEPKCNSEVQYVIFGIDVSATNTVFRGLFLAVFGLVLISLFFSATGILSVEKMERSVGAVMGAMAVAAGRGRDPTAEELTRAMEQAAAPQKDPGRKGLYMLGDLFGRAYIVAMLEVYLSRNATDAAGNDWGFGQIFAMLMLIAPIIDLVALFGGDDDNSDDTDGITGDDVLRFLFQPFLRAFVVAIDMAFCAAAGAGAVAAGAHANGDEVTGFALRTGALAGVIASGTIGYSHFVWKSGRTMVAMAVLLFSTWLGTAFIVALVVCGRVLGETPNAILLAALAAGGPMMIGNAWYIPGSADKAIAWNQNHPGRAVMQAGMSIGFDALAGYTLASVARNHGYPICEPNAAAAAGAVFSTIVWTLRILMSGDFSGEEETEVEYTAPAIDLQILEHAELAEILCQLARGSR
ncbi:hypothetical protein QBC43DRAFT_351812 [Cladorrhinum sp. PSN259]|nr:hypothetical protein QBC43DRAFT_351812 [Cladorrhinum sp. PSN259]